MTHYYAVLLALMSASAIAGIDPGWIVAHGPTYAAQTGDVGYTNAAAILAWDEGRLSAPQEFPRGIAVPDVTRTNVMVSVVAVDGVVMGVDAHASPFDWAAYTQRVANAAATNQAIRDGFRSEVEDSKTNRQDCVKLITAQTNGIAQMQALVFSATPTGAQIIALRDACVADAQRQRDTDAELRQTNAEMADVIRLLRRQLMDARPEATPQ